jgi:hypothetical protein
MRIFASRNISRGAELEADGRAEVVHTGDAAHRAVHAVAAER